MDPKDFLNRKMEKIYDFLDRGIQDLINSETFSKNIKRNGNLLEIKTNDPIYIFPNERIFHTCAIAGILNKMLKENDNTIILLNQHPGEDIFNDTFPTMAVHSYFRGLDDLVTYYDLSRSNEGRIVSLGGSTKAKAIKWFKERSDKNSLKFIELLNDILSKMNAKQIIEEFKNLQEEDIEYYNALGNLYRATKDDASKKIIELRLYLASLPSAAHIRVGNNTFLVVPGELPTLVLPEKISTDELRDETKSPSEKLSYIIENIKPLTLTHIAESQHGSVLDMRLSDGRNVSAKDLYQLDKIFKISLYLPVKDNIPKVILDEKHSLEREILKQLLFIPVILTKNSLDHVIAGSYSVNNFSVNDPTKGISLYGRKGEGIIKLDPHNLERNYIEIYYPIRKITKKINLNKENKKVLEKTSEVLSKYNYVLDFFKVLSDDKLPESVIKNGILESLILDEARKYLEK